MSPDSTDEQRLSKLFAALANPMVRHFIELLALERRLGTEVASHFDLVSSDVKRLGASLRDLGLISKKRYDDFVFEEGGLAPIEGWLDRIRSLKKPAPP
jgi:DNA-binding transcriptional ArsR family regulator